MVTEHGRFDETIIVFLRAVSMIKLEFGISWHQSTTLSILSRRRERR